MRTLSNLVVLAFLIGGAVMIGICQWHLILPDDAVGRAFRHILPLTSEDPVGARQVWLASSVAGVLLFAAGLHALIARRVDHARER
jgi:hypothetical protein